MKSTHKWLKAAVATVGAGALTFGGAALAATAQSPTSAPGPIAGNGDKYEAAAGHTGSTVSELKAEEKAGVIKVSDFGSVYHIDPVVKPGASAAADEAEKQGGAAIPGDPAGGSRPGAPVTIYLDFDGETLTGTNWNVDAKKDTLTFTGTTHDSKAAEIWAGVAEDYAPFNVNVTTTRPSNDKLYKTSMDDNEYGVHVIITDSYDEVLPSAQNSSGIAWLNGAGSDFLTGAFVFTKGAGGADATAKTIADTASHEAGHNFGLEHDGLAAPKEEYYYPRAGVWGPIMGATFDVPVSQWSKGEYANSSSKQDDLAEITDRSAARYMFLRAEVDGAPYTGEVCTSPGTDPTKPKPGDVFIVPNADGSCSADGKQVDLIFSYSDRSDYANDTVGDDIASATVLDNASGSFTSAAVIERNTDLDVFRVATDGGTLKANVAVADLHPNLDAKLTLTDASGKVLAENNPESSATSKLVAAGMDAEISAEVAKGTYYLTVEGTGAGTLGAEATNENAGGYTKYGSLGNYTLSGSVPASTDVVEIAAPVIKYPTAGVVTPDTTPSISGTGIVGATVTVTLTDAAGKATTGTATVDADGNWEWTTAELALGDYTVSATQMAGGQTSPASATVAFTVKLEATPTPTETPTVTPTATPTEIAVTGAGFDLGSGALLGAGLLALGVTTALVISQRRKLALAI